MVSPSPSASLPTAHCTDESKIAHAYAFAVGVAGGVAGAKNVDGKKRPTRRSEATTEPTIAAPYSYPKTVAFVPSVMMLADSMALAAGTPQAHVTRLFATWSGHAWTPPPQGGMPVRSGDVSSEMLRLD